MFVLVYSCLIYGIYRFRFARRDLLKTEEEEIENSQD